MPAGLLHNTLKMDTSWEVSKYGPEITPYFDTFHAVEVLTLMYIDIMKLTTMLLKSYFNLTRENFMTKI